MVSRQLILSIGPLHIFVSHVFANPNERAVVRRFISHILRPKIDYVHSEPSLTHQLHSLSRKTIQKRLERRIAASDVIVVVATAAAEARFWIRWEIKTALKLGKPIVLVHPEGRAPPAFNLAQFVGEPAVRIENLPAALWEKLPQEARMRLQDVRRKELEGLFDRRPHRKL